MLGPVISFGFRDEPVSTAKSEPGWMDRRKGTQFLWHQFRKLLSTFCAPIRSRGIQEYEVRFFFVFSETLPHVRCAIRSLRPAISALAVEIPRRGKIGITHTTFLKRFCQRKGEEPDSRIQIRASAPCPFAVTVFRQSSIRKRFT